MWSKVVLLSNTLNFVSLQILTSDYTKAEINIHATFHTEEAKEICAKEKKRLSLGDSVDGCWQQGPKMSEA